MRLDLPGRIHRTLSKGENSLSGRLLTRQISYIIDSTITPLFLPLIRDLRIEERICLVAIGGYGRMELAPHSDIDLLYLHDNLDDGLLEEIISTVNNFLFDSGMQVGHTCRTIEESKLYIDNIQTFHSILDSRFLAGAENLYLRYEREFLDKLPEDLIEQYNEIRYASLEEKILKSHTPLLLTEPNIKNGPLGLRDIQTIYWIEKTNRTPSEKRNGIFDFFTQGDTLDLVQAYDFFLKTRVILHKISKKKTDRLELSSQAELAEAMGFGERGLPSLEAFVSTYYKHQKDVFHYIGLFLDRNKFQSPSRRWKPISQNNLHLYCTDNYLYPPGHTKLFTNPDTLYQDVLSVFLIAQEQGVDPSPTLLDELRFAANFLDDDFKNNKSAIVTFLKILKNNQSVGKYLTLMHQANILGKFIPEFGACTNFPLFSYHHEYPVDEHTLLILRELDLLVDGQYSDPEVQSVFESCTSIPILYLALLIHDAGKVKEGDHCQYGAELSRAISERLGLSEDEADLYRFLVERHIDMSEVATKRDIFDPNLIKEFSELVQSQEKLTLLYILTIIDTKSVGPHILTNWKKDILFKLYRSVTRYLESDQGTTEHSRNNLTQLKNYLVQREDLDLPMAEKITDFADRVKPSSYLSYNTHRRIFHHYVELQLLKQRNQNYAIEFEKEPSFLTIIVFSRFRKDILLHIAGSVSSLNLNLVGMRPFHYSDEQDDLLITQVQITDSMGSGDIPANTIHLLRQQLDRTLSGSELLQDESVITSNYFDKMEMPEGLVDEMVEFNHTGSEEYTILEVRLPDSIGLLFRILEILLNHGLEVVFARIATSADFAYDTFYLLDRNGNKLEKGPHLERIRDQLMLASRTKKNILTLENVHEIVF